MNSTRCFTLIFIIGLVCLFFSSVYSADLRIKSTIAAVTVYNDQALIARIAKEEIPAGIHKITVINLPAIMIDQSLKVTGTAPYEVKISDIKIEQLFLDTIPEGRVAELYQRLYAFRNEKNILEQEHKLYMSQHEAVEALRQNYTKSVGGQNPGQKASVEEWDKLLQFMEKKKSEFTRKADNLRREIDSKLTKIKSLEEEIKITGGAAKKIQKQIAVVLNSSKTGIVNLEISYLISEASWIPMYEARVQSSEKLLQLVYSGNVRQSSGEDWNNVDLVLSTARPALSSNMPILTPWTVDTRSVIHPSSTKRNARNAPRPQPQPELTLMGNTLYGRVIDNDTREPLVEANVIVAGTTLTASTDLNGDYYIYNIPEGKYKAIASKEGYQTATQEGIFVSKSNGAKQDFYLYVPTEADYSEDGVTITAQRPRIQKDMSTSVSMVSAMEVIRLEESFSTTQATSSLFSIPSKQTIPSDNQSHKVGISIENLPINFTYNTVAKLVPSAFLTGKGKNTRNYPLLAGDANVFMDNSFITTVSLKTIMPNDSFSLNLGIDEAIRVGWKIANKYKESVGTFSTKTRVTYEFENTVENHKKFPVEITLSDQVPVSFDERIVIEVLEPDPKVLSHDTEGIFKWRMNLQTGEKKIIKLKFSIEAAPEFFPRWFE